MSGHPESARLPTVTFDLTPADVRAYRRFVRRTNPRLRVMLVLMGVVFVGLFAVIVAINPSHIFGSQGWIWIPVMALMYPLALHQELRKQERRLIETPGVLGWHSLELTQTGALYRSLTSAAEVTWRQVTGVVVTPEHVLLILGPASALFAPLRSFSDHGAAQAFADVASRLREQGISLPTRAAPPLVVPEGGFGIEYELTEDDLRVIQYAPIKKAAGGLAVLGMLMAAAVLATGWFKGPLWAALLASVILLCLWGFGRAMRQEAERALQDGFLNRRFLLISPVGVSMWTSASDRVEVTWTRVQRVEVNSRHILIRMSQESWIPIPLAGFRSKYEADAFIRSARDWHGAATAGKAQGR